MTRRFFKHKKENTEEPWPSAEKELWLARGDFRPHTADALRQGYYGLCSCSGDGIAPPEEATMPFYRLVLCTLQELLGRVSSAVIVDDVCRKGAWENECFYFKQMAEQHGGVCIEARTAQMNSFVFLFSAMPQAFLEEIFWWMAGHACKEDVYARYSTVAKTAFSSVSEVKKHIHINVRIDEEHPVLVFQTDPTVSVLQIVQSLQTACKKEGWTFKRKEWGAEHA